MSSEKIPKQSLKSLINACIVASVLALIILFVAILPAEYGIDPTGLGKKMGLVRLSQSTAKAKDSHNGNCETAAQADTDPDLNTSPDNPSADISPLDTRNPIQWKDSAKIVIPPQKGLEYKFAMAKGAVLAYSWSTDGASLYFDFHGEPKGATDGYFKSYLSILDGQSTGLLTAPFEGIHGWYWENDTDKAITIQLNTKGDYQVLGIMK